MLRLFGKRSVLGAVLLAGIALTAAPAPGAPKEDKAKPTGTAVHSPDAKVLGGSLAEWLTEYWRWYYSGDTSAPYQPDRQPIMFLPIPAGTQTGGDWSPDDPGVLVGQMEVTIPTGTHLVLPFFAWTAERYDGYPDEPDDPFIPDENIDDVVVSLEITLDGQPLVEDWRDYYVSPTMFDPIVMYPEPSSAGTVGVIGWQGTGVIYKPLPPGRHVLHLVEYLRITEEEIPIPGYGVGVVYDNTWIINVVPRGQMR